LFTASLADSKTDFDGAIGIAAREEGGSLSLLPPLVEVDGVNNELERPHPVARDDSYYLFFSTQARTFHPDVTGPTGLYGFVGLSLTGPWEPLNGSGLILRLPGLFVAGPERSPVASFIDFHSLSGRRPEEVEGAGKGREHFGGALAPFETISVEGSTVRLLPRR
jgi:levansucrase